MLTASEYFLSNNGLLNPNVFNMPLLPVNMIYGNHTRNLDRSSEQIKNLQYSVLRTEFLGKKENQICPITGKLTTDIHHKKGRVGELFLDTKYWVALSREGHRFVEENPEWAKENGYSLNRLTDE